MLPLQVIDGFLLNYNAGQALLLVFLLTTLGALPLKSGKILALNSIVFGTIFILTPQTLVPFHYMFLGIGLLVVGPMMLIASSR